MALVELLVVGGVEALGVNTEISQKALYHIGVSRWCFEALVAPVTDERSTTDLKLVASGVATEVVVVVENQDARLRPLLQEEVRGRQAAEASPHDEEVVDIVVGPLDGPPIAPTRARELVGDLERTDVASPKPRECRWIAGRSSVLQREHLVGWRTQRTGRQCAHPVQEISAGDGAIHPEVTVSRFYVLILSRFRGSSLYPFWGD